MGHTQSAPASKANNAIMARGAWTQSDGGSLRANLFTLPTNPANTSAVWWAGKLLALCEGGMPVEVDADTLRTKGEVDFGLKRQGALAFSAHYKVRARWELGYQGDRLKWMRGGAARRRQRGPDRGGRPHIRAPSSIMWLYT